MEDLVEYSLEIGIFDQLATLDLIMLYIHQLKTAERYERALILVWKTVEARDRLLGKRDTRALATSHLLPFLLNKTKMYKEAMNYSIELLKKEERVYSAESVTLMESEGELAIALFKLGDLKGAN